MYAALAVMRFSSSCYSVMGSSTLPCKLKECGLSCGGCSYFTVLK